jgi:phosphoribosylglycinamide formyltransferase-1
VKVGVLASGAGTNLQALLDDPEIDVVGVASDKAAARALERADEAGVERAVFPLADFADRPARDGAIADWLDSRGVELVVLAGYMALLTSVFLDRFPERVINVHPSLLPSFPGLKPIERAIEAGVAETGVTVHYVDGGIDTGPVIAQQALAIETDDPEALHDALRPIEHALLTAAVKSFG